MKPVCRKIQEMLAEQGAAALRQDAAARAHVEECDACVAVLEALSTLDEGLRSLPLLDADDAVVDGLLMRPELNRETGSPTPLNRRRAWMFDLRVRPRFAWSGAAAAVLLLLLVIGAPSTVREMLEPEPSLTLPFNSKSTVQMEALPDDVSERAVGLDDDALEKLNSLGYIASETETRDASREQAQARFGAGNERGSGVWNFENAPDTPALDGQELNVVPSGDIVERGKVVVTSDVVELEETAPTATFSDGDGRANLRGSRSRDFKGGVGGVSNVDPVHGEPSRIAANSIEEMQVTTEGAGSELGRAEGVGGELGRAEGDYVRIDGEDKNAKEEAKLLEQGFLSLDRLLGTHASDKDEARKKPGGPVLAGARAVAAVPVLIEESRVDPILPALARWARIQATVLVQVLIDEQGTVVRATALKSSHPDLGFEAAAVEAVRQWRYTPATTDGKPVKVFFTVTVEFDLATTGQDSSAAPAAIDDNVRAALAFFRQRETVEGLTFQPASGYWSNTYVPGDPEFRRLAARLKGWDRAGLEAALPALPAMPRFHEASRRIAQPFDPPRDSALAVYLQTDRKGIAGPSRVLLQVGLRGSDRHGGRRPAMNLALVLDLPGSVSSGEAIAVRSLVDAFREARQPGDRFSLFVAGRGTSLAVGPEDFRHGYLEVTLNRLFAGGESDPLAPGLVDAMSAAIQRIAADDDPQTPLGSSSVLLITGRTLSDATRSIADLAHQSAIAGIPVSVVDLRGGAEPSEIERVVLAGQGRSHLLGSPAEAARVADAELFAATRAVARAVRLRIRLAPGVRLIDVLGSKRLDVAAAQRVRDTERSIDLRLSRNLGIEADRGDDEEGVQIVIPSFYAGDSHVILLDMVVDGPGPLADVTVRYKDLVQLRNGVGRASVALGNVHRAVGPLERNVLKNLLSRRLAETLERAGRKVAEGDHAHAEAVLASFQSLLQGVRSQSAALDNNSEFARDVEMLAEYRTLIAAGFSGRQLVDSLHFAAWVKVQPRPLEISS